MCPPRTQTETREVCSWARAGVVREYACILLWFSHEFGLVCISLLLLQHVSYFMRSQVTPQATSSPSSWLLITAMAMQRTIQILDPFGQVHGYRLFSPRAIIALQTCGEDVAIDETNVFSSGAEARTVPLERP